MKPLNVCILMGGLSAEREVSLKSGQALLNACQSLGHSCQVIDVKGPDDLNILLLDRPDVTLIALHGGFGEDGHVQAWLELHDLPYLGSCMKASAIAMDKQLTKQLWRSAGLPVLPDVCLTHLNQDVHMACADLSYPLCVKPISDGSSIGVERVESSGELYPALERTLSLGSAALVEPWVEGIEFTVGMINHQALPVTRIEVSSGFYDFKSKYTSGLHRKHIPSGLGDAKELLIKSQALQACHALGVRHIARVDGLMNDQGEWFFLEINTLPGLTQDSLVPAAAQAMGISFEALVERLIDQVHPPTQHLCSTQAQLKDPEFKE